MKKTILMIIGAGLILASCATGGGGSSSRGGKKPSWVEDRHGTYPQEKYLVEIGEGTSLKKAKQDAAVALSQIFRTTVKVDSTVRTRYRDLSDGRDILDSSVETTADETITQLSDETLVNLHFGESWTDQMGRTYVAAYIDRLETAGIYRRRIEDDGAQAEYFIRRAQDEGDLLRRFGYLDAAVVMDKNAQMMLDQLDIIHGPSRRSILPAYDSKKLYDLYGDTASQMVYSLAIEGDEGGRIASSTAQVLTARGFGVSQTAANLSVSGRVLLEDAALDNGYENVRWTLYLEMRNQAGETVVTMEESKRETGISREAALSRSYRSMEEMLQKKFIGDLERYLDGFVRQ